MSKRYLVVRTDRKARELILRELEQGRLRQGWGWLPEQDLTKLADKAYRASSMTSAEASAWRNRRLLPSQPNGVQPGDIIVLPNLPEQGKWVLARVTGGYRYEISEHGDYGHIVAVEPIRRRDGKIAVVEADNEIVAAPLRASMRSLSRTWSIDSLGTSVDRIIAAIEQGQDIATAEPAAQKLERTLAEIRAAAWESIRGNYKGAELEHFVHRLFERIYPRGRVEPWGGPAENGADLIVYTTDELGIEYKIAVQVKCYEGAIASVDAIHQIERAHRIHKVDAGVIVTTAVAAEEKFLALRDQIEGELGIDIRVIVRDEFIGLVLQHLAAGQ